MCNASMSYNRHHIPISGGPSILYKNSCAKCDGNGFSTADAYRRNTIKSAGKKASVHFAAIMCCPKQHSPSACSSSMSPCRGGDVLHNTEALLHGCFGKETCSSITDWWTGLPPARPWSSVLGPSKSLSPLVWLSLEVVAPVAGVMEEVLCHWVWWQLTSLSGGREVACHPAHRPCSGGFSRQTGMQAEAVNQLRLAYGGSAGHVSVTRLPHSDSFLMLVQGNSLSCAKWEQQSPRGLSR